MINLVFNKKNTKRLIQASAETIPTTKSHLDWSLENEKGIFGCVKKTLLKGNIVFILMKEENHYRLICSQQGSLDFYCIEDIDNFLQLININELSTIGDEQSRNIFKQRVLNAIKDVRGLPYTGLIETKGNKIFLYDYIGG